MVVIDDQEVVRIGVRAALERNGRIEIVAEGATEADALRLANAHHPDVLLLGLSTINTARLAHRHLSAFDTIRRLVKDCQTKVLVLSRHGQKGLMHTMLHVGASGFMLKDEAMNSCEALAQAVVDIFRQRKLPMRPIFICPLLLAATALLAAFGSPDEVVSPGCARVGIASSCKAAGQTAHDFFAPPAPSGCGDGTDYCLAPTPTQTPAEEFPKQSITTDYVGWPILTNDSI